jgi:hypothetical protein
MFRKRLSSAHEYRHRGLCASCDAPRDVEGPRPIRAASHVCAPRNHAPELRLFSWMNFTTTGVPLQAILLQI